MHQIQLNLTDQLYSHAMRRAIEAGFTSLDEFLAEIIENELATDTENLDDRFTPKVLEELDRVSASVKKGAKTLTQQDVDEHFRQKSKAWQDSRLS